jgi:hypothetical protein
MGDIQRPGNENNDPDLGAEPDDILDRVAAAFERIEAARKQFRRKAQFRAFVIVLAGGAAGSLLLLGSEHTRGYAASLLNGLGAGALTAAVVAMATPFVVGLWHAGDTSSNAALTRELKRLSDRVTFLWYETIDPGSGRRMETRSRAESMERLRQRAEKGKNPPAP